MSNDDMKAARGADVAIEFSTPEAAVGNIEKLAALGVPVVVGTTGWLAEMDRVRAAVEAHGIGIGVEPEFFDWRECVFAAGSRGGEAVGG